MSNVNGPEDHEPSTSTPCGKRSFAQRLTISSRVCLLFLMLLIGLGLAWLWNGIQRVQLSALRSNDKGHLKQIAVALYHYHDIFDVFPPRGSSLPGEVESMSWQTVILPYINHNDVYEQFDQSSAWNSPRHEAARSQQISPYLYSKMRDDAPPGISHVAGNIHLFPQDQGRRIGDVTDGTSHTIFVGEVATGFKQWADPTNVRDPQTGIGPTREQFGSPFPGSVHFLFVDGSVQSISDKTDIEVLRALGTPNGGEKTDDFKFD